MTPAASPMGRKRKAGVASSRMARRTPSATQSQGPMTSTPSATLGPSDPTRGQWGRAGLGAAGPAPVGGRDASVPTPRISSEIPAREPMTLDASSGIRITF